MEKEQVQDSQPTKPANKANGEKDLRTVDNICTIVGRLSLIASIVWAIVEWSYIPLVYGISAFISMWITACFAKAIAFLVKIAQLYWDKNA